MDPYYTITGPRPDLAAVEVNPPEGFIGSKLIPLVNVADKTGTVYYNDVTADVAAQPDEIKAIMAKQLCSPVRWYDCMRALEAQEVEIFAEIGPGKVLAGLIQKILPPDYPAKIYNINDLKSLENFFKAVA